MGSHINLDLTELILIYITEITDPEEIINFTYRSEYYNEVTNKYRITFGTGIYNNTYNVNIIIVAPS